MDRSTLSKAVSGGHFSPKKAAALLAAALTVAVFCAADVIARSYPFGPRTRSVNDLGNQYVPFHAHLWDLLHGRADGGLFVNWQSGYGSSFLPDLGTYLSSPFALLVAVFPRDEIDLAVYVITVLKTASAGAAMAWLLLSLRPGRWWGAGLLGASYAMCGWSVAVASYNPMWLDGLVALPLLCLVGEWAMQRRHPLLGVLIVALAWIANFYTAYMATLCAALVLLLRLWLSGVPGRRRLETVGRAVVTVTLGVGLAAPLVVVVYFGTRHAYPGRVVQFAPVPAEDMLARLLPTTYSFGTPAVYVGTAALLLALALPFHRAVPRRVRAGWTLLVAAVALSLQWGPTHLVWHAFATPQGSAYRQAFVLCALLVIAAWHSLSYGPPDLRALGAAAVLLALIAAVASRGHLVRPVGWGVLLLAVVGALGGLMLLGRTQADGSAGPPATARRRGVLAGLAVVLLFGGQFGETAATSAVATRLRLGHMDDYAPWGARQQAQAEAIAQADGWPRYRTDPGREQTVGNDPMLVGGQGAQYYSSLTSAVLSRTLTALGGGWTSRARSVQSLDNDVTDAIFSVGARVHSPPDPHQGWFPQDGTGPSVSREDVPPLVTLRPGGASSAGFGPSPYRNQELLLGSRVYTVPRITVRTSAGRAPQAGDSAHPGTPIAAHASVTERKPTITARCPAGDEVYLWAPHYSGTATTGDGPTGRFRSDARVTKIAAMQRLGRVPASGRLTIELAPSLDGRLPDGAVGCLDTTRLHDAVERLRSTGATRVTVSGSTIRAELPAGSRGTAVVAAPRIAGWRCAAGDANPVPAGQFHGLIAVPVAPSTNSVSCTFHPPGLRLGTTVGAAALLTLILLGAFTAVRRRRAAPPPAPPTATTRPREPVTGAL
ncbi:YfhO family protein [Streptomyces sp. NBC_00847]|uniref:YfhO family protein n=1 Tax=unclassified Streptomyces TaxID=2593676 RepID=UPI00224E28F4|nr:YfhO family protein [Streptomyces sp. NBC_00847]MCX4879577.1 YfhO family protein [Streptomyces sp. NBC_00847]